MKKSRLCSVAALVLAVTLFAGCANRTVPSRSLGAEPEITVSTDNSFVSDGYVCEVTPLFDSLTAVEAAAVYGDTLYAIADSKLYSADLSSDKTQELTWYAEQEFSADYVTVGTDGVIWLGKYNGEISAFLADGTEQFRYKLTQITGFKMLLQLFNLPDGAIGLTTSNNTDVLAYIFESGGKNPLRTPGLDLIWDEHYASGANTDGSLLCYDGLSVFTADYGEAYEPSNTRSLLFEWLDANIGGNASAVGMTDENTVIVLTDGKLMKVRKVLAPVAETPKKELVLAVDYASEILSIVNDFNAASSEYKIRVKNYPNLQKLATEIIAGEIPDIISVNGSMFNIYASKGLFVPLESYLEADGIKLIPQVQAAMETNGTLYRVAPGFNIQTTFGNKDYVGANEGWTYEELLAAFARLPDGATVIGKGWDYSTSLEIFVDQNLSPFVNWDAGEAYFDSADFKSMLEFVKSAAVPGISARNALLTGEVLIGWCNLFRFPNYIDMYNNLEGKLVFKGYPSADRNMGVIFPMPFELAITTACSDKEGAWSFLRYVLNEYNVVMFGFEQGFYSVQSRYDEQVRKAMSGENPMTEAQYEIFRELLEGCSTPILSDRVIFKILQEETASYFEGQKGLDEVCKIIQSRVTIYMNEQL